MMRINTDFDHPSPPLPGIRILLNHQRRAGKIAEHIIQNRRPLPPAITIRNHLLKLVRIRKQHRLVLDMMQRLHHAPN